MENMNMGRRPKIESNLEEPKTPDQIISYGEKIMNLFCKNFETNGLENLNKFKKEHPNDKFIFVASHTNNLDAPAALKTFGHDFNIQTTGNELFFKKAKFLVQNLGIKILFGDHFTALGQKESDDKKEYGIFRPENFTELDQKMEKGRTPWMAAHSFSVDGKMRKVDNGALIESYRQNAWLIPVALEITSGSDALQGVKDLTMNLKNNSGARYHIGEPYKPNSLPENLNINLINEVIEKRKKGESVSNEEFENFKTINHFLSDQSENLGKNIASMLPEKYRGYYAEKNSKE